MATDRKRRVSYFYDADFGSVYYGANHPMKPHRLAMTHSLVLAYGLHEGMEVYRPRRAYPAELTQFHSEDYIDFLAKVTPDSARGELAGQLARFNMGEDCPVFDGLYDFCRLYTGASITGATRLNHGLSDVAINWAGGLHHAKKAEASGFCYVNDLVLAILELLKYHARVMYVDIDIHHGDGVEEAFYLTDRVMCASFHRYGDAFFPGTGAASDVGERRGRGYSLNIPLREGVDDATFHAAFKPVMARAVDVFRPGAIVLQCGADSLGGDRLGCFNLTVAGHAEAVRFVQAFGLPTLVTGGGGYTKAAVARCWAAETAVLTGVGLGGLADALPPHPYLEYYAPTFALGAHRPAARWMDNGNARADVERLVREACARLAELEAAPGVQMGAVPPDALIPEWGGAAPGGKGWDESDDDAAAAADERLGAYGMRHLVVRDPEGGDDGGGAFY